MQLTDWLLVEVALLLLGLTHVFFWQKPVLTLLEEIKSILDYQL
jgi:hypothetical protein